MLNLFYLDDGTLGGDPLTVLADLQTIIEECKTIGLEINPDKCELFFCHDRNENLISAFQNIAPGIKIVNKSDLTLLGSPILVEGIAHATQKKIELITTISTKLRSLNSHIAYFLLKNCFAAPKLIYFLRTTPLWLCPSFLTQFDDIIKHCLESLLNISLEDKNWTLASLPIRYGGLGISKISDICLPAFLSSAFGVFDFVKSVFINYGDNIEIQHLTEAIESWKSNNASQDIPAHPEIQKNWDNARIIRIQDSLVNSATSDVDHALYLANLEKEAGSWLYALPSANIGTLMDNISFRIAVGLRLGCKICQPHVCLCGAQVDHYGRHGLSCYKNAGRISRHSMLNDIIKRALISVGVPTVLEPPGVSRSDGKRPDGLTLIPWTRGKSLLWDATCVDTLAPSHLPKTCRLAGSAAMSAVSAKRIKYRYVIDNYHFVVFAVETLGPWCSEAKALTSEIGRKLQALTGDNRCTEYLRQRISIAIQKGNAASVMGTFPDDKALDEVFHM